MPESDIEKMSLDELWALHLDVNASLSTRLTAEKQKLEKRLRELGASERVARSKRNCATQQIGHRVT